MFERFTDRSRKVMALANQEAQRFNHDYIGTEHILLGLVKEGSGVGANVLKTHRVDLRKVRLAIEKLVKSGPEMVTMGRLPHTPRAKKAMEYAIEESRGLGHNYIGTEHLLLGLIRETDGVATQVLSSFNITADIVRHEIMRLLGAMQPEIALRDEVDWFAKQMESRLKANENKDGWQNESKSHLLLLLMKELYELTEVISNKGDANAIIEESADVANFAMMIADLANQQD